MNAALKEWGLRIVLVLFGLLFGLAACQLALVILHRGKGTNFSSLDDVRQTILNGDGTGTEPSDPMVRSANLRSIINPHPDSKIIYELRPNLALTFQGVPVRTNSCGMRGPEYSLAKPADTFRIAVLGDSFTFGWGVREEESFSSRLEAELNERAHGALHFQVLNMGVPGYSTAQEVHSFLEKGLDFQPDAVLVFFIQNDFGLPFFVPNLDKSGGVLAGTELARLARSALDPRWEEHQAEIAGYDPNRALQKLAESLSESGIEISIAFNTRKDWIKDKNRLWILKKRPDIRVIDMYKNFENFIASRGIDKKTLVLPNDPHPSALRHAIWGAQLASFYYSPIAAHS